MQNPDHLEFTTTRLNPHVDPALHVWGWEVPFDLFLGGAVAGLLVLYALVMLFRREGEFPTVVRVAPLLAAPLLGIGLLFLFLDLEYKLHAFRFYTTFEVTSPMSWGSWILLATMAVGGLQFLYTIAELPRLQAASIGKWKCWELLRRISPSQRRGLAFVGLFLGVGLGTYTGLLLASSVARPLWNSGLIAPIFLVSGIATGAAILLIASRSTIERWWLALCLVVGLAAELLLIVMWLGDLAHGGRASFEAGAILLGGSFTASFWTFTVVIGLLMPGLLEVQALRGKWRATLVAPVLVLIGGLALRLIIVQAGQSFGYGV